MLRFLAANETSATKPSVGHVLQLDHTITAHRCVSSDHIRGASKEHCFGLVKHDSYVNGSFVGEMMGQAALLHGSKRYAEIGKRAIHVRQSRHLDTRPALAGIGGCREPAYLGDAVQRTEFPVA